MKFLLIKESHNFDRFDNHQENNNIISVHPACFQQNYYFTLSSCHHFFSCWVFFHEHSRFRRQLRKGEAISSRSSLPLQPTSQTLRHLSFIYLFITLFDVGTLKQLIANKNQPLNIKKKKTIIITQINVHIYTAIFILNNPNEYLWNSLCYF